MNHFLPLISSNIVKPHHMNLSFSFQQLYLVLEPLGLKKMCQLGLLFLKPPHSIVMFHHPPNSRKEGGIPPVDFHFIPSIFKSATTKFTLSPHLSLQRFPPTPQNIPNNLTLRQCPGILFCGSGAVFFGFSPFSNPPSADGGDFSVTADNRLRLVLMSRPGSSCAAP